MKNSWIIAKREIKERLNSKFFLIFLFIGPCILLLTLFFLFKAGDEGKDKIKLLVSDEGNILEGILHTQKNGSVSYQFSKEYISFEDFRTKPEFQQYDALLDLNHKLLENKTCFIWYREKPSVDRQISIRGQLERRIEEVMVNETSKISMSDYKKIKQPLNMAFRDVYDPRQEEDHLAGWSGFAFGLLIMIFIFLFGMTILRSTTRDKSNRIVEVILASVKSTEMMFGKIIGLGVVAFFQFFIWIIFVALGLYFLREQFDLNIYDGANQVSTILGSEAETTNALYLNKVVELVYERINYGVMLPIFLSFFTIGYVFYAAFFAVIGASSGSESDGQQFIIPLLALLGISIYAGYLSVEFPDSTIVSYLFYIPFTSPMVAMVKLAQGFSNGDSYTLLLSFLILIVSAILVIQIAAKIFKNGILAFGHRLSLKHFILWIRQK
ncbi:MAG: ABC transporter permease [Bacteroidota bacterium]